MLELRREERSIKHKERILIKELHGERHRIPFSCQVALYIVDGK